MPETQRWLKFIENSIQLVKSNIANESNIARLRKFENHYRHLKTNEVLMKNLITELTVGVTWRKLEQCFKSRIESRLLVNLKHKTLSSFMGSCSVLIKNRLRHYFTRRNFPCLKLNVTLTCEFHKTVGDDIEFEPKYFQTRNTLIFPDFISTYEELFNDKIFDPLENQLSEFESKNSGWKLYSIDSLAVNINQCGFLFHASSFIELPDEIKSKKAVLNIHNKDDQNCFFHSVVASLFPYNPRSGGVSRVSSYPDFRTKLNVKGFDLTKPMPLDKIPKFEEMNQISVNVFCLQHKKNGAGKKFVVAPIYVTKKLHKNRHVNLLMLQANYADVYNGDGDDDEDMDIDIDSDELDAEITELDDVIIPKHYCLIKNLSRLVCSQLPKHDGKTHICCRCLQYFQTEKGLDDHSENCEKINECKITLPDETNNRLYFKNHKYKQSVPYTIYSDIECVLAEPIPEDDNPLRSKKSKLSSKTSKYQKHVPFSISYYFHCNYDPSLSYYKSNRDPNCMQWFAKELENIAERFYPSFSTVVPMEATAVNPASVANCFICDRDFTSDDIRVRDHDHFTGKFRGICHQACNLNYKVKPVIPVIFHNFSHYDAHFILRDVVSEFPGNVSLLPINTETYISFIKQYRNTRLKFKFMDSFRFMDRSLAELASYLKEDDFHILKRECNYNEAQMKLLMRKGCFPYDYLSSTDRLLETQLPPQDAFYNKLCDESVSDQDYAHAMKIWESFNLNNLGEYSDLYLKTDVLLLADVFENFRASCRSVYKLDPANYFTLPGYAWDVMLYMTKVELTLLTDIDMLLMTEMGIRGGISQAIKRYSRCNNKYYPSGYDDSKPSTFLNYLDVNNLYGWAMQQYLPYQNFSWVGEDQFDSFNVMGIADDSDTGYMLQVDLEYPQNLHDIHKDFPMCAERMTPPGSSFEKLMTTLYDKEKYVIHYRNLKQCLRAGLKLKKIHKILQFDQSPWMRPYIELNTKLRENAANDFEKNLFKLMNNAVFGKTMENVRKHRDIKLVTKWEGRYGAQSLISLPNFHSRHIFNENLVAIELNKTEIKFMKPVYVGQAILDMSKTLMYDFHYEYMTTKFPNCQLLYMDTDSFIYESPCDNFYESIKPDLNEKFDTSDYKIDNPYNMPRVNKKKIGLMKDEMNGRIITEFVALRSKMYSIRVNGVDCVKKSKGTKKYVVQKSLTFDDYYKCLTDRISIERTQNSIQSRAHKVYSISQRKVVLNSNDDKRYILPDGVNTLPWNHYLIPPQQNIK